MKVKAAKRGTLTSGGERRAVPRTQGETGLQERAARRGLACHPGCATAHVRLVGRGEQSKSPHLPAAP